MHYVHVTYSRQAAFRGVSLEYLITNFYAPYMHTDSAPSQFDNVQRTQCSWQVHPELRVAWIWKGSNSSIHQDKLKARRLSLSTTICVCACPCTRRWAC